MADVGAVNDVQLIDDHEINEDAEFVHAHDALEIAQAAYEEAREDLVPLGEEEKLEKARNAIWNEADKKVAALQAAFDERHGLKELADEVAEAQALVDSFSDRDVGDIAKEEPDVA